MLERFMTVGQVEKRYVETGQIFGNAVSYIHMGECVGFARMLAKWEKWEAEYAKRGYRTLPVDDFVAYGGYGKPLKDIGVKRADGEDPIFHAQIYREIYLGKIQPAVNFSEPTTQMGTYFIPSTKKVE